MAASLTPDPYLVATHTTAATASVARWVALVELAGVVLVLVYVLREPDEVRAISLRRASKQERKLYAHWQDPR